MRCGVGGSEPVGSEIVYRFRFQDAQFCSLNFDPRGWECNFIGSQTKKIILETFADDQVDPPFPVRSDDQVRQTGADALCGQIGAPEAKIIFRLRRYGRQPEMRSARFGSSPWSPVLQACGESNQCRQNRILS